jgi:rhomboid protease GluP
MFNPLASSFGGMMNSQERRSILCPNCRRLISVDESPCPYCGLRNPGSRWKNNFLTGGFLSPDQLLRNIIALNVFMFILSILISPTSARLSMNPFDFMSPGNSSLLLLGATGAYPIDRLHRWWTLLSANFLHGSILHILFNMMAIRQIAPLIIEEYGAYRTIAIFIFSGVGGYLLSYFAGVSLTIGASAALCGLIGAAIYYGKSRGGYFGEMVYRQVGGWAVGTFIFGFLFPGINNWAHGGGLLTGVLVAYILGYRERIPENLLHKTVGILCALSALASLLWAIGTTFYILLFSGAS